MTVALQGGATHHAPLVRDYYRRPFTGNREPHHHEQHHLPLPVRELVSLLCALSALSTRRGIPKCLQGFSPFLSEVAPAIHSVGQTFF